MPSPTPPPSQQPDSPRPGATETIALVMNEGAGNADPGGIEQALRDAGATSLRVWTIADALDSPHELERAGRIVVAGGDGSIGPIASIAARAHTPFAVVPAGTANDFARAMGIPDDVAEACRLAVQGERTRPVSLAWFGDHPFMNVASLGLAVPAAQIADDLKPRFGAAAYAVGAVRAACSAHPLHCTVTIDGEEAFAGAAWQLVVANSGAFGGVASIELADVTDAVLDVSVLAAGPRRRLASYALGLRAGNPERAPGAEAFRGCQIRIEVPAGTSANVDGEVQDVPGSVDVRIEPGALSLLVPNVEADA